MKRNKIAGIFLMSSLCVTLLSGADLTAANDELPVLQTAGTENTEKNPMLTYEDGNEDSLRINEAGRVYLDNMSDYAIQSVRYTGNNDNVIVDEKTGEFTIREGYIPKAGETVTIKADITYYPDSDDVIFTDSFEGEKKFVDNAGAEEVYTHSNTNSLFGRYAATTIGTTPGNPSKNLSEITDVTVTAWYYDDCSDIMETKYGFSINGEAMPAMGIVFDTHIAPYVDGKTQNNYACRLNGYTYEKYSWGATDAKRSKGWHKFQWIVTESGLTLKIDDKIISTSEGVKVGGENAEVKVENHPSTKNLTSLHIMANWLDSSYNRSIIQDKHFIDGVMVVKNTAQTEQMELTSVEIPLEGPKIQKINSAYPEPMVIQGLYDLSDLSKVYLDDNEIAGALWTAEEYNGPVNSVNYPSYMKGWQLTVNETVFKDLGDGTHKLTLAKTSGEILEFSFDVENKKHIPKQYYLSNNTGNDNNSGNTPQQAWKSFEKLSEIEFGPGDTIYLDAQSVWSGVKFAPKGSGAKGAPIIITKYNDGGDASKRPILNGDGTVADREAHSYLAFEAWRGFYPSGTIELFNVEYWEIKGIEITNYSNVVSQEATGRNGIAIIHDYFEVQNYTTLPTKADKLEEAYYTAGKLEHIVVEDCYIHDVNGYHPSNGAEGKGSKLSGGINIYGPYDDVQVEKNIIMYCDVEGIRNDVLAWGADTQTQFPAYMEDINISNNFIAGVSGDGIVVSSANAPRISNNYLTDAGHSYFATVPDKTPGATIKEMGNRDNPIIMSPTSNFAGFWFIGTVDAVAEFNELVNNVWACDDGEAFDADMFCHGTIFQHNYTYKNNGGFCLFMFNMKGGTLVRYNISVEDGEGLGIIYKGQTTTLHYSTAPEAIHNNLFILGKNVKSMFGGYSNTVNFYNNIVIAPNGNDQYHLNGARDSDTENPPLKGSIKNNLFYPGAMLDTVTGSVEVSDNIKLTSKDDLPFHNLDDFMNSQPIHALNGRSEFKGDPITAETNEGPGMAMSVEAGRSVKVPDGTGFDYTGFDGIKTVEGAVTIGKGIPVTSSSDKYPLSYDFFKNDLSNVQTPDIGPYQWSSDLNHYVKVSFDSNGGQTIDEQIVKSGTVISLPVPEKTDDEFLGWFDNENLIGEPLQGSYTVPLQGVKLYAKWASDYIVNKTITNNKCDFEVINNTENSIDVYLIASAYENEVLIDVKLEKVTVEANGKINHSIALENTDKTVKAFVWDTNYRPL